MYNITTFNKVFQYQIVGFNSAKSQLLFYQPSRYLE